MHVGEIGEVEGQRTRELRRTVLRPHLAPGDALPGDDLAGAVHIGALDEDGEAIGACLIFDAPCDWRPEIPAWQLRSMATAERARGRGVGRAVADAAADAARARGAVILWCHARESAAPFWLAAGWSSRYPDDDDRQVYIDPDTGLPHRDMWRTVR